jgi:uncharacterized protein YjiK
MINKYHNRFIGCNLQPHSTKAFYLLIFLLFAPMLFCYPQNIENNMAYKFAYNLNSPDEKYVLPPVLEEVSGIALLNDNIMICIQDEKGYLFFYDLDEKRLIKRVKFGKDGDYEDVTLAGDKVYVLRSNGKIYELDNYDKQEEIEVNVHKTRLQKKNNCEGICFDPAENCLLVALKDTPEVDDEQDFDGFRAIYKFNLQTKKVKKNPAYLIELKQLMGLGKRYDKSGKIRFNPSAIAIHPITDEIYVLASVGKALLVMGRNGELKKYVKLDKKIFPQPEGICFAPDGTMYISSEGKGGSGMIMKFGLRK